MEEQEKNRTVTTTYYPDERFWTVFVGFWIGVMGLFISLSFLLGGANTIYRDCALIACLALWLVSVIRYTYVKFFPDHVETRSNFFFYRRTIPLRSITSIDIGGTIQIPFIVIRYETKHADQVLNFPVGFFEPSNVVVDLVHEFKKRNPNIQLQEALRGYLKKRTEKNKKPPSAAEPQGA